MSKRALITGITGQDGSYFAGFLLGKGYEVHGVTRRASLFNTQRIDHIYQDRHEPNSRLRLHYGDLSDGSNLTRILSEVMPDKVYNLDARSHVAVSFEAPVNTADVDALGDLRLLEAIRFLGLEKRTRFYQASTPELYGLVQESPQSEQTPFHPRSPYSVAKLYAYWITVNYREAYGLFACNGILFNHESPRRGETFVTRKITRGLANVVQGLEHCLYMGNLDALRDWGHAKDYVRAQWMILQQEAPEDYVIATGQQHSVRDFVVWTAAELGLTLSFQGREASEVARVVDVSGDDAPAVKPGQVILRIDPKYFRPAEVDTLLGDPTKAREELGWEPEITAREMCADMVAEDLKEAKRHAFLKASGYDKPFSLETQMPKMTKLFLAGHGGMVGSAILRHLEARQYPGEHLEIVTRTRDALDLTSQNAVRDFMQCERPDTVVVAAAKVGGIFANNSFPAEFIYDNLMIEANVIHEAFAAVVERLLFLGSSCIYPKLAVQPITEDAILTGRLEPTNEPYAIAKIAGIKLCESYNRQGGVDYRSLMPTNLYGPGDNFHPDNSHVLPAFIRRFHEAVEQGRDEVVIWGSGTPRREFLHVDDMATASLFVLELPKETYEAVTESMVSHLNVGTGNDVSIRELAQQVADLTGFRGRIVTDPSKPDGTPRKLLDVQRLARLGWRAQIALEDGLRDTYEWFIAHSADLRA